MNRSNHENVEFSLQFVEEAKKRESCFVEAGCESLLTFVLSQCTCLLATRCSYNLQFILAETDSEMNETEYIQGIYRICKSTPFLLASTVRTIYYPGAVS